MSDISWTGSFSGQPIAGFTSSGSAPSYAGFKFKKDSGVKLPSFKGIDFQTGKRVDLANYLADPVFQAPSQEADFPTGSAVGDLYNQLKALGRYQAETLPQDIERARKLGQVSTEQQLQQLQQLYPFLSAAGQEATARSLAASQAYRAFAEQLPSSVQNIMASKQQQRQSAQLGEAALQQATADQLRAAKESQGRFAGQYIQFG